MQEQLIFKLHEAGVVKFGQFTLKSGLASPIYIDFRLIVSYPDLLEAVAEALWSKVKHLQFQLLCGVPYTALPIATALSLRYRTPMVMRRKEVKEYGTKQAIEGVFAPQMRCLVIEDLITSGSSLFETIAPLEHVQLQVKDVAVVLDREQGARARLESKGYNVHSAITLSEFLAVLENAGKLDRATVAKVLEFIRQIPSASTPRLN